MAKQFSSEGQAYKHLADATQVHVRREAILYISPKLQTNCHPKSVDTECDMVEQVRKCFHNWNRFQR